MEYVTQGVSGYLYPTCKELQQLSTNKYLIKFVSIVTKENTYCWVTDISDYPLRNQKFLVTEKTNPTTKTNEVRLKTTGIWNFYVYEYVGSEPNDEIGLNQVEQGRVKVIGTTTTNKKYTGYQSELKQYNG